MKPFRVKSFLMNLQHDYVNIHLESFNLFRKLNFKNIKYHKAITLLLQIFKTFSLISTGKVSKSFKTHSHSLVKDGNT